MRTNAERIAHGMHPSPERLIPVIFLFFFPVLGLLTLTAIGSLLMSANG